MMRAAGRETVDEPQRVISNMAVQNNRLLLC